MKKVAAFLDVFKNITPPERFVREVFMRVVSETHGIALKEEEIQVQGNILFIQSSPIVKNELFLKKDMLLQKVNQELQQYKKLIKNIR